MTRGAKEIEEELVELQSQRKSSWMKEFLRDLERKGRIDEIRYDSMDITL